MKTTLISLGACFGISLLTLSAAQAAPASVTLAGSLQSELGCSADWQPSCSTTFLQKNGDLWTGAFTVPAGSWQYKMALDGAWTENYGANKVKDGDNISFALAAEKLVTFTFNEVTHEITDDSQAGVVAPVDPQPDSVVIAGDLQAALGCSGDWLPACSATQLSLETLDGVWQKTLSVPAGNWNFKATLNGGWAENYGANASAGGSNIALSLAAATDVKFYYSHKTHWVTSDANAVIATAVGNFQSQLGCSGDWQPDCLRTWLQDPDGNGLYTFSTTALAIGDYSVKVALNEAWDESYGNNGGNIEFAVTTANQKVVFTFDAVNKKVYVGDEVVAGDLKTAKAYWLSRDTIALDLTPEVAAAVNVKLHYSTDASLTTSPAGVSGGQTISLSYEAAGLSDAIKTKYRHLKNLAAFKISASDLALVPSILQQQIAVSATNLNGNLVEATGLQFAGALDDLFTYSGSLGVNYAGSVPSVKLWAPTAQQVNLHVFADADASTTATVVPMTFDAATGVWSLEGNASWERQYYLFEVNVFVRQTGKIEKNLATDPYSLNTSANGKRSQFINLNDADLKPDGWDTQAKPAFAAPEDMAIYELHVRDFSIADETVPSTERGTFAAFTETTSNGMKHLQALADAGMTHIHLLPVFDCATINENKAEQKTILDNLGTYAPDSEAQQAAVEVIRGQDGFNWCYDPHHYTVPDGSYATTPDGTARIREFRSMVASLNKMGLRVVMDVVYNHTSGSLLGENSVLDKVVPSYYHRLNAKGDIETSTCCVNTASENNMMEKLMADSIKTWATAYKVDGFRYDIMGHHTKDNILNIKHAVQALTPANDGLDGSKIYFYGEGWNFGEVQNNARFTQATLGNMSGTGVGTFNNFIRDAVRGGGPFDSGIDHVKTQSFINGLYLDPNAENTANADSKAELLKQSDVLRVVLAGSLADYSLVDRTGATKKASAIDGAGYTQDPQETINYIEAHDNETLFDMIQYKAPLATSMAERVRMQNLGNSIVVLAQGIPFIHAGQDMLRSKSTDRNSYDAGDWFNAIDYTYQHNGWGKGLPLKADNEQNWAITKPLLANAALMPTAADIARTREHMTELLKIRRSSKLFRLEAAAQIQQQVAFYNTGAAQKPGVIAMALKDSDANLDPNAEAIVVIYNANTTSQTLAIADYKGWDFSLHAVQQASSDSRVKTAAMDKAKGEFTVPARTMAVFVATQKPAVAEPTEPTQTEPAKPKKGGGSSSLFLLLLLVGFWAVPMAKRKV